MDIQMRRDRVFYFSRHYFFLVIKASEIILKANSGPGLICLKKKSIVFDTNEPKSIHDPVIAPFPMTTPLLVAHHPPPVPRLVPGTASVCPSCEKNDLTMTCTSRNAGTSTQINTAQTHSNNRIIYHIIIYYNIRVSLAL